MAEWAISAMMRAIKRSTEAIQLVGEAVMGDRGDARIADQHLVDAACRRVALVGREDVGVEQRTHAGERARERARDLDRALAIGIRDELLPRCELQLPSHLLVRGPAA